MSEDIHDQARERYEQATAFIRRRIAMLATAPGWSFAGGPIYFSPLRNSLVIREGFAVERRVAGERDRREWIEGVRRRLGLVAEVHRCRVWQCSCGAWEWFCKRNGCGQLEHWLPSRADACTGAITHARAFIPEPPEETPVTELDWDGYVPLVDAVPWGLVP